MGGTMSPAATLLADLEARGIEIQPDGDRLRFRPKAAMTADLAERVKACKTELLAMLGDTPSPEAVQPTKSPAGRECERFLAVCRPHPDGRGWYDPAQSRVVATLAHGAELESTPVVKQPGGWCGPAPSLYKVDGQAMTFSQRAVHYRAGWRLNGYPPGIRCVT